MFYTLAHRALATWEARAGLISDESDRATNRSLSGTENIRVRSARTFRQAMTPCTLMTPKNTRGVEDVRVYSKYPYNPEAILAERPRGIQEVPA